MQIEPLLPWEFLSPVLQAICFPCNRSREPFGFSNYQLKAKGTFANRCAHFHCMSRGDTMYQWLTMITNLKIAAHDHSQHSELTPPFQGVWGFIAGGLCWFAIPFGLATTMGLAYLGLSSAQGAPMLTDEDVMKGKDDNSGGWVGDYTMTAAGKYSGMPTGILRKLSLEFLPTQSCTRPDGRARSRGRDCLRVVPLFLRLPRMH